MVRIGNGRRRLGFALSVLISGFALLAVAGAAPAAAETCPNEQVREESLLSPSTGLAFSTQLSDCRAYEMVSPPFKAGINPVVEAVSPDGNSTIVETSAGTFAGTESNVLSTLFLISRTATGWKTAALNPPAARFPANVLVDATPDLSRTLWTLRGPPQSVYAKDLYLREPDGTFVKVGPMVPPAEEAGPSGGFYPNIPNRYQYLGASADLSHIVFRVERNFQVAAWPGDTTARFGESLYEYVGIGNTRPELVGVSDGATTVDGETLPQGTVISNCGTTLGINSVTAVGAQDASAYNAISNGGNTIYFTALGHNESCGPAIRAPEVSELYARVGGIQTVPISEPTSVQCQVCNTEVRSPASYRGASRDGSKVFFETEQELLTGAEGNNLYLYDFERPAGQKVLRVSTGAATPEVQGVARISEDGTHAYFVAAGVLTGPNAEGIAPSAEPEAHNLYVYERDSANPGGRLAFVAALSPQDSQDWEAEDNRRVEASPDGRFLLFQSVAHITPGDTSAEPQVFEYDSEREELVRVSVGQSGFPAGEVNADANASSFEAQPHARQSPVTFEASRFLAISDDGTEATFSSRAALTPGAEPAAAAGALSVYEYRSSGSLANGDVDLLSQGSNPLLAQEWGMSPSGADVFFTTYDPLVAQDADTERDLYDARTEGGFPVPATAPACQGEACQGPQALVPATPAASTPHFFGPANPKPSTKCKSGFIKRHGKCIKKSSREPHGKGSKRRASGNRGGGK
jgi:hypothetical protein